MTWHSIAFNAALASCCLYALWCGGRPERQAAAIAALAAVLTYFAYRPHATRFIALEPAVLAIDLLTLTALVWLALRCDRYWPLCAAGFQAASIVIHLAKAMLPVSRFAYAVGAAFWGYGILAAIATGTWRHRQRTLRR